MQKCNSNNLDAKSTLAATTCKKDFCILCCNITSIMTGKRVSKSQSDECQTTCGEKFNDKK